MIEMNVSEFMNLNPELTALVALLACTVVHVTVRTTYFIIYHLFFKLPAVVWSRFTRMMMVRKHGWPPPHLDADGDWKLEPKKPPPEPEQSEQSGS